MRERRAEGERGEGEASPEKAKTRLCLYREAVVDARLHDDDTRAVAPPVVVVVVQGHDTPLPPVLVVPALQHQQAGAYTRSHFSST